MPYHWDYSRQRKKLIANFKAKRNKYFSLGLALTLLFLTLLYLGPLEGLEKFGFFGLRKEEEQPSFALTSDSTWSPAVSLSAGYESLSVSASYQNDQNQNNSATVEYRKVGEPGWTAGGPVTVYRGDRQWRSFLVGLVASTDYDVRVTFSDPDGVEGGVVASPGPTPLSSPAPTPTAAPSPATTPSATPAASPVSTPTPTPISTPQPSPTPPPSGTIFSDNFESGNTSQWTSSLVETGNTLEVIGAAAQEGSYGMHVVGTPAQDDANVSKSISGVSEIWTRVMMKLVSNVGDGNHLQIMAADSTTSLSPGIGSFWIRTKVADGYTNRAYTFAGGSFASASDFQFATNQWYCVEQNVKVGTTDGAVGLWVNGSQIANRTGLNTGSANVSWLGLGVNGGNVTSDLYFDDFKAGSSQIGCPTLGIKTVWAQDASSVGVVATAKTRGASTPSSGNSYYVAPSGSDSNPGTEAAPFATVQKAANTVSAGDTVFVKAGTYSEMVTVSRSGSAANYITFKAFGDGPVWINANCSQLYGIKISGSYLVFEGLGIKLANESGVRIDDASDIKLDKLTIQDYNCANVNLHLAAGVAASGATRVTIVNSTMTRRVEIAGPQKGQGDALWFKNTSAATGGGHLIANNNFIGGWDGVGGEGENSDVGILYKDSVVENNTFTDCDDDGIQVEGGTQNVYVRNNTIRGCAIGIAFAPSNVGPLYIERNRILDLIPGFYGSTNGIKTGDGGSGTVYLTENEFKTNAAASCIAQTNAGMNMVLVSRGNVYHCDRYIFEITDGVPTGSSLDYDCLWTTDPSRFIKWAGSTQYSNLNAFQAATDYELNGQQTQNCSVGNIPPSPLPSASPAASVAPSPASTPSPSGTPLPSPSPSAQAPTQIHLSTSTGDPSTEVTATWKTPSTADDNIRLGTSAGVYTINKTGIEHSPYMSGANQCCFHSVQVTGLSPDITYYYQVGGDVTGWSPEYSIRTALPKGSTAPFTFVAYADHGTTSNSVTVANRADAENPSFVVLAGDLFYTTSQSTVDTYFNNIQNLATSSFYMAAPGNHEWTEPDALFTYLGRFDYPGAPIGTGCPSSGCTRNAVPELWYSFNWGNTHIVSVNSISNSSSGGIHASDPGVAWITNDLQTARADPSIKWIIAYMHHPLYANGKDSSHSSNTAVRTPLEPIFKANKVDMVIQAHQHSYERTLPVTDNGVTIDTTACGSAPWSTCTDPLYPIYLVQGTGGDDCTYAQPTSAPWSIVRIRSVCGYNKIQVNGNQLTASFLDTSGAVRDSVTVNKGAVVSPLPSPPPLACALTGASWNTSAASEGQAVTLTVLGNTACNGKEVRFEVFENDSVLEGLGDDNVTTAPVNATFSGTTASTTWTAEYQEDGLGGIFDPPEYYFNAILVEDPAVTVRSADPLLEVNKAAGGVNVTTPQALTLAPTYESISIYAPYSGDQNQNNSAVLEYKTSSSSTWVRGHEMFIDRNAQIQQSRTTSYFNNPFVNQARASVLLASVCSDYDVRVTFADPDGVSGSSVTSTIKTRCDPALGSGTTYYVAPTGSDSNTGTEAAPFATIQRAANSAGAGSTVLVKAGTYSGGITIPTSGTANNFITFMPFGSDAVTIDGSTNHFTIADKSYIRIKGFKFTRSTGSSISISGSNAHDIVIEDGIFDDPAIGGGYAESALRVRSSAYNIVFQRNTVNRITPTTGDNTFGIYLQNSGGGHVVRNNTITGSFRDGLGGEPNYIVTQGLNGGPHKDTDIYNNKISGCADDGIENEGPQVNVRVWDNVIKNCLVGIGLAPQIVGPSYTFRNILQDNTQNAFKLGELSRGKAYVYHNTIYSRAGNGIANSGGSGVDKEYANFVFNNNIVDVSTRTIQGGRPQNVYNFDNLVSAGSSISWCTNQVGSCTSVDYSTLAAFQAGTSQELSGLSIPATAEFVDVSSGDFRLRSGSQLIDKGRVIAGMNDTDSAWPYSGAAPDAGAYEVGAPLPSPLPSPSPVASPSPSLSPSPLPSPSPLSSPSALPTPSPTPTPSPLPSPTPSPIPSPTPVPCALNGASWSTATAVEGQVVTLNVLSNDSCSGKEVRFEVKENDSIIEGLGDDDVTTQPVNTTISGTTATTTWTAEYQEDGFAGIFDPPEYYFNAILVEDSSVSTRSADPLLEVSKVIVPTPSPTPAPSASPSPSPSATPTPEPSASPSPPPFSPLPSPLPTPSPSPSPSATPAATPSPTPEPCLITAASWSTSTALEGEAVRLDVLGTAVCSGKQLSFEVYENDSVLEGLGDDNVATQPVNATFSGTNATTTWIAEYQQDGIGGIFDPPEYYFNAILVEDPSVSTRSADPLLEVTKPVVPLPTPSPSPTPIPTPVPSPSPSPVASPSPSPSPTPVPSPSPSPIPSPSPSPVGGTPSPSPLPSATPTPPIPTPSPTPEPCVITAASWSTSRASEGEVVSLNVLGTIPCDSKQLKFAVKENDSVLEGLGDDDVRVNPQDSSFVTTPVGILATTTWTAEYQQDGIGGIFDPPEYYFNASLFEDPSVSTRSTDPLLEVTKPVVPLPSPTPSPSPIPTPLASPAAGAQINSFSPTSGKTGTLVSINGLGFGDGQGEVMFGGVPTTQVDKWTDTQVVAAVETNSLSGNISLRTVLGETVVSQDAFKVIGPRVKQIRKKTLGENRVISSQVGTSLGRVAGETSTFLASEIVEIIGEDFGDGSSGYVDFNGLFAQVISWSNTKIEVAVPEVDPNSNIQVRVVLPAEVSNQFPIAVSWGVMEIETIEQVYAYADRDTAITIEGKEFLETATKPLTVSLDGQALGTTVSEDNEEFVFVIPRGLPAGGYQLTVNRGDGNQVPFKTILVTKPGDFWSPSAQEGDEQVRDGKITIEDLSRFLSVFWQKADLVLLTEGDINFGPGDASRDKIDIYDLNKMMVNWDSQ